MEEESAIRYRPQVSGHRTPKVARGEMALRRCTGGEAMETNTKWAHIARRLIVIDKE
jgi:hypothetical protein